MASTGPFTDQRFSVADGAARHFMRCLEPELNQEQARAKISGLLDHASISKRPPPWWKDKRADRYLTVDQNGDELCFAVRRRRVTGFGSRKLTARGWQRLSAHAIERYRQRVEPELDSRQARRRLIELLDLAQLNDRPPSWLTRPLKSDAARYLITSGFFCPVRDGCVTTVIAREPAA